MKKFLKKNWENTVAILKDESGFEFLQIAIVALIMIIVGGSLLSFLDVSIVDFFTSIFDKAKSTFSI